MQNELHHYILWVWLVTGFVWLVASPLTKQNHKVEAPLSAAARFVIMVAAFVLVFLPGAAIGVLAFRLIPISTLASAAGLVITVAGAVLAMSSRIYLGGNWSAVVTIKEHHELIRKGPYALVRHPIYSAILLGLAGAALANGELRCVLGVVIAYVELRRKYLMEEKFLVQRFGAQYEDYRARVKALVPFIL